MQTLLRARRASPLRPRAAILLLTVALYPHTSLAASATWVGGAGSLWNSTTNWSSAPLYPNGVDDAATFSFLPPGTLTLNSPVTLGSLLINATSPIFSNTFSLAATNPMTFSSTTGSATLLASPATIAKTISLTGTYHLASGLTISAPASIVQFQGTLTGSGNLTFNAGTLAIPFPSPNWTPSLITFNSGVIAIDRPSAGPLGDPNSGTIIVKSGAVLSMSGAPIPSENFTKTVVISGSGTAAFPGALVMSGLSGRRLILDGTLELDGPATIHLFSGMLHVGRTSSTSTTASLIGSGGLTKAGAGTLSINIAATHSGGTFISGGVLALGAAGSLVRAGDVTVNPGGTLLLRRPAGADPAQHAIAFHTALLNGGTLDISDLDLATLLAPTSTGGALTINTTTYTGGGTNLLDLSGPGNMSIYLSTGNTTVTLPTSLTLIPPTSDHTFRFLAPSSPTSSGGAYIVNTGLHDFGGHPTSLLLAANVTLAGANTHTGPTTVSAGTTTLTHSSGLGSPLVGTTITAGTLVLAANSPEPFTVAGGLLQVNSESSGPITVTGGTIALSTANAAPVQVNEGFAHVNGPFAGSLTLTKGSIHVSKPNTATYQINGGYATFAAASGPVLMDGGAVDIKAALGSPIRISGGIATLSAVNADSITVAPGGRLNQVTTGSFLPGAITLQGGRVSLSSPFSPTDFLHPASTGGLISLDASMTLTGGAAAALDFSAMPAGHAITFAATSSVTIPPSVLLKPDAVTRTLRFGGENLKGTFTLAAAIADFDQTPTHLHVLPATTLLLQTASSYSGITTVSGNLHAHHSLALGAATGTDTDGTLVLPGATLSTAPGVTLGNEKITLAGGTLAAASAGPLLITGPAHLSGNFSGPVTASAPFTIRAPTQFSGPFSSSAPVTVTFGASTTFGPNTTFTAGLLVEGSTVTLSAAAAAPEITVRHQGMITANVPGTSLAASLYQLQSGQISVPLSGAGTIVKSTAASFYLGSPLRDFTGTIVIDGGDLRAGVYLARDTIINAGSLTVENSPTSSGVITGAVHFGNNTRLVANASNGVTYAPEHVTINGSAALEVRQTCYVNGLSDTFTDRHDPSRHLNLIFWNGELRIMGGRHHLGAATGNGAINVQPGATLTLASAHIDTVHSYGTLQFRASPTPNNAVSVLNNYLSSGQINGQTYGQIDVTNHAIIMRPQPTLRTLIASGRADGLWNGPGIVSSTVPTSPGTDLALVNNADLKLTLFRGAFVPSAAYILVQAHIGDANLDGLVNAFDLNLLASHWQQPSHAFWSGGDFTGDGKVDAFDLNLLAAHWQFGAPASFEAALSAAAFPVPEPSTLALLALAAFPLLTRRPRTF